MSFTVLAAALLITQAAARPDDLTRMTPDQLKSGIQNAHPAAFYVLAGKLLESGQRDDAVFWFYAGQLRFRFHLAANPTLEPSGDPALFASFSEVVGRPINEYAFGDLPALRATIERVLAWDKANTNGFTSVQKHARAWQETRAGLEKLITYIDGHAEEIRQQRTANGLENRTLVPAAAPAKDKSPGFRTIPFFEAGCKQFVPLPLEMSIPSDDVVRDARPWGCFWGAADDLDRVLASRSEVDFGAIHRGVYWCRPSTDTGFDPVHGKFVNAAGPQENWPAAFATQGITGLTMVPKTVGGIATLQVSGTFQGKRVYMLYVGFGDSPAVLISYTPPAPGRKADEAEWARFLQSVRATK